MSYTAIKGKPILERGLVSQPVTYSDGSDTVTLMYQTKAITPDWPDSFVRAKLEELNAVADLTVLKEGPPEPPPIPKPPDPPTQDQLDLQAWVAAKQDYQLKKKVFDSGLSKTVTQQDVDDAYALMKTLYKEEYGVFV